MHQHKQDSNRLGRHCPCPRSVEFELNRIESKEQQVILIAQQVGVHG